MPDAARLDELEALACDNEAGNFIDYTNTLLENAPDLIRLARRGLLAEEMAGALRAARNQHWHNCYTKDKDGATVLGVCIPRCWESSRIAVLARWDALAPAPTAEEETK